MKPKTCSLEPAQMLRELGVTRESYFCHYGGTVLPVHDIPMQVIKDHNYTEAYTVAELFSILKRIDANVCIYNVLLGYLSSNKEDLADRICYRIIYLLENGHVKVEEVNETV